MLKTVLNTIALLLSLLMGTCGVGSIPCRAQQPARTYRVQFHTVNGMIPLDATVNDKPATLLLDTGANLTIASLQLCDVNVRLRALTAAKTTGAEGEYVKSRVDLRLAERHWIDREILVMDLSEASKLLGTRIDCFVVPPPPLPLDLSTGRLWFPLLKFCFLLCAPLSVLCLLS